ncbi:hypothetical protein [Paenibacillus sp. NFR01]|uniref:hypothetical protein n=1 Tax=Paenibacillus sp. NFR01 TaxID=1566279 RepID=UPI0008AF8726|nr:hypothetical protein [Paenibacillus sp. NFR01]SEU20327.1 hypothetical protein SAMN03159358_3973 [Paenibacillus sp. NFR01]
MMPFILCLVATVWVFTYFVRKRRPRRELWFYVGLSALGLTQIALLAVGHPLSLTAFVAGIIDLLLGRR